MVARLASIALCNQKVAGSSPAVVIVFGVLQFLFARNHAYAGCRSAYSWHVGYRPPGRHRMKTNARMKPTVVWRLAAGSSPSVVVFWVSIVPF